LANLLRCELEKRRRVAEVRSFPYVAVLDVTNLCNLRCPYCPTGSRRNAGRGVRTMDLSVVDRLLEEFGDCLISVNLFNWGEPLLHPQLATIVSRIHARRVFTQISSNLSGDYKATLEDICRAGLDYLVVSTSGASQNVHELYHRNGRLALVADNIRAIAAFKRTQQRRTPVVEWKFLMFKHNAHEVDAARALAKRSGADLFRVVRGGGEESALVDAQQAPSAVMPTRFCHQLWHMIVLNSDGGIAPCCYLYFKEDDFANVSPATLTETRNNPLYVTARRLFDPTAVTCLPHDLQHPCLKCGMVHGAPHLREYLAANPHAAQRARTGGP
jgi:organic radical activating enzyme